MNSGKNSSLLKLTENQVRLIEEITIILAVQFDRFMREFKDPNKMMQAFSALSSSEKNLARLSMGINLKFEP